MKTAYSWRPHIYSLIASAERPSPAFSISSTLTVTKSEDVLNLGISGATTVITSVQNAHTGLTKKPRSTAEIDERNGPITGTKCSTNVAMPMRPA